MKLFNFALVLLSLVEGVTGYQRSSINDSVATSNTKALEDSLTDITSLEDLLNWILSDVSLPLPDIGPEQILGHEVAAKDIKCGNLHVDTLDVFVQPKGYLAGDFKLNVIVDMECGTKLTVNGFMMDHESSATIMLDGNELELVASLDLNPPSLTFPNCGLSVGDVKLDFSASGLISKILSGSVGIIQDSIGAVLGSLDMCAILSPYLGGSQDQLISAFSDMLPEEVQGFIPEKNGSVRTSASVNGLFDELENHLETKWLRIKEQQEEELAPPKALELLVLGQNEDPLLDLDLNLDGNMKQKLEALLP